MCSIYLILIVASSFVQDNIIIFFTTSDMEFNHKKKGMCINKSIQFLHISRKQVTLHTLTALTTQYRFLIYKRKIVRLLFLSILEDEKRNL